MFKQQPVMERHCHILQDKLLKSLNTYIKLYSCQKDNILKISDDLAQLCPEKTNEDIEAIATKALQDGFFGASFAALFGAIGGSITGALGSVGAAAVYSGNLNAVGATVGLVGGVMGGMVGGTFSGVLGGALGAAAESAGHPYNRNFHNIVWCFIGAVTGDSIGRTFGGEVGALGGAFGGGLGGLFGVTVSVDAVKNGIDQFQLSRQARTPEQPVITAKQAEDIQKIEQTFQENTTNLVGELFIINCISGKMDTKPGVHIITVQSAKGLAAVARVERELGDARKATSSKQMTSCVGRAVKQFKQVSDEMEKMKIEAEKLLASWSILT